MSVEIEIQNFISQVQNRIKMENAFEKVIEDRKLDKNTWDVAAKRRIGKIVEEIFKQCFLAEANENAKKHYQIYIEGGEKLPEWWTKRYLLFGSGVYPDIGVLVPKLEKRIAIELDHSQGIPGSKFKIALAKAAFGYLSHEWDYCYVLFHNRSGKPMAQYLEGEVEKEILNRYKMLQTRILIFE